LKLPNINDSKQLFDARKIGFPEVKKGRRPLRDGSQSRCFG